MAKNRRPVIIENDRYKKKTVDPEEKKCQKAEEERKAAEAKAKAEKARKTKKESKPASIEKGNDVEIPDDLPPMPKGYKNNLSRCGCTQEQAEQYWARTCMGDFREGDIIYIPEYVIVDWGSVDNIEKRNSYGYAHTVRDHKYLAVRAKNTPLLEINSTSDIQLILIDGVHPDDPNYKKVQKYNEAHPETRISIPKEVGLENDYYANAERLFYADKEDLLDRGARVMGHFPRSKIGDFEKIALASSKYGRERYNIHNMPRNKGIRSKEHNV